MTELAMCETATLFIIEYEKQSMKQWQTNALRLEIHNSQSLNQLSNAAFQTIDKPKECLNKMYWWKLTRQKLHNQLSVKS